MYAITGISGKVGGQAARTLLERGHAVRAIVRDARKGVSWDNMGCDIALAEMSDADALIAAFKGTAGVFVLLPPVFDPSPGFPEARAFVTAIRRALDMARPAKVVCISTIGAQAKEENLLTQLTITEQVLGDLPMPITFLRPAWFMENSSWDVPSARDKGTIASFLQPLDRPVSMVATADVGRTAADLLEEQWTGRRVVELEGPARVTPTQIAATFSEIFDRPVRAEPLPRDRWKQLFESQGMTNPQPRMRMLDGFSEGWIDFEYGESHRRRGNTELKTVLTALANADAAAMTSA